MATIRKREWQSAKGERKSAWVADYLDQAGKRHLKTFPTRKAADAWLVKARDEVARGTHTPENASITVAEAADLWLQRGELEGLERATLRQYADHVRLHIKPRIGVEKLARLTTPRVETFRDRLVADLSRAMATKVLASFKRIISEAQRRGLVAHNVALPTKVRANSRDKARPDIPSKDEVRRLIDAATGRWRPLIVVAVFTGLRASELRGLTWADVDLERKVLAVRQRANMWGEIGAPKSQASDRGVPLAPPVVNALREWKLACPRSPLGLVFPNGKGNVESHQNILHRGWYPIQRGAGVVGADGEPRFGLHSTRHFFASWIIERGFSPKRCQALLGHASIAMTFDRYGHLFPSLEDDHAKFEAGSAAVKQLAT